MCVTLSPFLHMLYIIYNYTVYMYHSLCILFITILSVHYHVFTIFLLLFLFVWRTLTDMPTEAPHHLAEVYYFHLNWNHSCDASALRTPSFKCDAFIYHKWSLTQSSMQGPGPINWTSAYAYHTGCQPKQASFIKRPITPHISHSWLYKSISPLLSQSI